MQKYAFEVVHSLDTQPIPIYQSLPQQKQLDLIPVAFTVLELFEVSLYSLADSGLHTVVAG